MTDEQWRAVEPLLPPSGANGVHHVSRLMGREVYHPAGDAAAARDAMFASWTTADLHERLEWLYG
ncbi:transposase [Lentzea atacamensis]|uniref:transposase n=1 Tax=Lentzea atacamensis TaxID=531938 RepID=UPI0011BD9291|nr:transposase [Lentzea atacamensis]